MEQTSVPGIQPGLCGELCLPAQSMTGSGVASADTGALLRDRAKGSGCVALAQGWWLPVSAVECLTLVPSAVAPTVIERVPASSL